MSNATFTTLSIDGHASARSPNRVKHTFFGNFSSNVSNDEVTLLPLTAFLACSALKFKNGNYFTDDFHIICFVYLKLFLVIIRQRCLAL